MPFTSRIKQPIYARSDRLYAQSQQDSMDDERDAASIDAIATLATNDDFVANVSGATPNFDNNDKKNDNTWIWKVVVPLWLVYVSNQWSRSSIYYLVNFDTTTSSSSSSSTSSSVASALNAMNLDIGFDETQYGILASVAFTSLFAITSLGAGFVSDRFNRKTLTIASIIGWTMATYGTATADSYETVVLWRVAMGFACAFSTPTAYTYLRDNVPSARQATASSLYGTGVALGSGLASYTLVLDNTYGWRESLDIIASAGIIATLLTIVLLPDDNKPSQNALLEDKEASIEKDINSEKFWVESIVNDIRLSFATDRARWIYLGSFVRFCSGLCIGVWGAAYFRMTFSDHVNDYAYTQAAISAIGASISGIAGGAIADYLSSSSAITVGDDGKNNINQTRKNNDDLIGRRLWVPVIGSLLAAPAWYMSVHTADSFELSMAWLATEYLVAECWFGPTISTLQTTVGPKIGGTAQGLFTLTGAIANFAPSILGYLYGQAIASGNGDMESVVSSTELSNLLTVAVCFGYVANAFCFAMAANAKPPMINVISDKDR
jgi:MFS family permease